MKVWLGKLFFFAWSQTADVLYTEVHKWREKVRGGECVDDRRNYTMIMQGIMLFVCGCYESELCLCLFIQPILYLKPPPTSLMRIWQVVQLASQLQTMCMALCGRAVFWFQSYEQSAPWWQWFYGMGRHKLRKMNTLAFYWWQFECRDTVMRSWGPMSCHSSSPHVSAW